MAVIVPRFEQVLARAPRWRRLIRVAAWYAIITAALVLLWRVGWPWAAGVLACAVLVDRA